MYTLMKRTNGNAPVMTFSGLADKFFEDGAGRIFDDNLWGFNGLPHGVNVPVNIRETKQNYEVELVAPGLKKEDFRISINGGHLTVAFEHHEESNNNGGGGWLRKEYQKQSFTRTFTLGEAIDAGRISASYADGILTISLPRKDGGVSRNIEIK